MEKSEMNKLLKKYYEGLTSREEEELMEGYFRTEEPEAFESIFYQARRELSKGSINTKKLSLPNRELNVPKTRSHRSIILYAAASLAIILISSILLKNFISNNNTKLISIDEFQAKSTIEKLKYLNANSKEINADYFEKVLIPSLESETKVNIKLAILNLSEGYLQDSSMRDRIFKTIEQENSYLVQMTMYDLMRFFNEEITDKNVASILNNKNLSPDLLVLLE